MSTVNSSSTTESFVPIKAIVNNMIELDSGFKVAGVKVAPKNIGVDVRTYEEVSLHRCGILDSYTSIDEALKNASSIACSYLRTNCLIKKGTTQNK